MSMEMLFTGTAFDNMRDAVSKGRQPRVKLTASDVASIRRLAMTGKRYRRTKAIAERFGISASAVRDIIRGDTWSWTNSPLTSN